MQMVPRKLQGIKKSRKLEEIQDNCQKRQEILLQWQNSRNCEQESRPLRTDELD